MKPLFRRLLLWLGLPLLMLCLLMGTALQSQPSVGADTQVSATDVDRAIRLLRVHDPRQSPPGQQRTLTLSQHELEVLLNHAARRWLGAATRVSLLRNGAQLQLSAHLGSVLPLNPFGRWLNIEVRLAQTGGLPVIDSVQVGGVPLPTWLAEHVALRLIQQWGLRTELELVGDVVQQVRFWPGQMQLTYAWRGNSTELMLGALLTPQELQRFRVYTEKLVQYTQAQRSSAELSLAPLMGPMFAFASDRTAAGHDAALENRAALVVLTLFANGRDLGELVTAAKSWPKPRPLRLLLSQRDDWPRHFLISAAVAAEGTGPLSKAIGVYKELADSRGGSGFSFNDMAANLAGTRFGELALQAPQRLQAQVAPGLREEDFMPEARDLPEFMAEADFLRRFGGVGAPAYRQQMAEIERRVNALRVLQ